MSHDTALFSCYQRLGASKVLWHLDMPSINLAVFSRIRYRPTLFTSFKQIANRYKDSKVPQ